MVEALRVLLACAVLVSLGVIVTYVAGFVAVTGMTVYGRKRPDAHVEELDRLLESIGAQGRQELASSRGLPGRPEVLGVHAGGLGQFRGGFIGVSERRRG